MVPLCQCHEMTGPRPRGDGRLKMSAARGYAEYLDAMADPNHEYHADTPAWRGPDFDPETVDKIGIRSG